MASTVPSSLLTMLLSYGSLRRPPAPSGAAKAQKEPRATAPQGNLMPKVLGSAIIRDPPPSPSPSAVGSPRPSSTPAPGSPGPQLPGPPSPAQPPAAPRSRIDRFLATPPSPEELAELSHGPRITLESDIDPNSEFARCAIDYTLAHMRAAWAIRFDSPVPVLGTTSLWDYIRRNVDEIRLFSDTSRSAEAFHDSRIMLWPALCTRRFMWSDPDNGGAGIGGNLPVFVHEARHIEAPRLLHNADDNCIVCDEMGLRSGTCPGGFGNGWRDSSLKYGGAGAAHYYTFLWLADHSGDWLSKADRVNSRQYAQNMLDRYFCDTHRPLALPSALS